MRRGILNLVGIGILGLVWFWALPGYAQQVVRPGDRQPTHPTTVLQQLAKARVVYLGETHDSAADHQAQLEILQALYRLQPKLAIGLEMFQRPAQPMLDRYLAGELTEVELQEQSQFSQRWGFPWQFYAPILRFAKQYRLPLLALNTPTEVTRKVAREGLASLTPADQQHIPAIAEIDTSNTAYRQWLQQIYQDHLGQSHSANFEHFFQAQVLWDETMAAAIADFLRANPDHLVVVLAGEGHIVYGYGIPSRVARRMQSNRVNPGSALVQYSIILNPDPDMTATAEGAIADYFWQQRSFAPAPR